MARLTDEEREKILADFHAGKSQNFLSKKYEVSPATINKLCKGVTPKNVDKVNTLVGLNTALSEQSEYEVNAIHSEVAERTRHIQFFTDAAVRNVAEAMLLKPDSHRAFKDRAETILKGKETVLGKSPETAIQINNEAQQPKLEVVLSK